MNIERGVTTIKVSMHTLEEYDYYGHSKWKCIMIMILPPLRLTHSFFILTIVFVADGRIFILFVSVSYSRTVKE